MRVSDKLIRAKEDYDAVYEAGVNKGKTMGGYEQGFDAGKQAEYDAFWDNYQHQMGGPQSYQYLFAGSPWDDVTFKPKYNIVFSTGYSGTNAFWQCGVTDIAEALEKRGLILDTTLCGYASGMFQTTVTKRLPELNFTHAMDNSTAGLQNTFNGSSVETIDKMIVLESLKYTNTFLNCKNLKNIVFEGVIGNAIDFKSCTLLSHDSIISIINALSTTASGQTATFSKEAVNNAFEGGSTGSEWLNLIAAKSNWTISLV